MGNYNPDLVERHTKLLIYFYILVNEVQSEIAYLRQTAPLQNIIHDSPLIKELRFVLKCLALIEAALNSHHLAGLTAEVDGQVILMDEL